VIGAAGVNTFVLAFTRFDTCWTNAGGGAADGVTAADGADSGPVPTAFVAATRNVYWVPLVRPVTVVLVAGGDPVTVFAVCAMPPAYGVTVYDVIALPPLAGAVHDTVAWALPAVATTLPGAAGAVGATGVTAAEAAESGPVPIAFVALTRNV